MPVRVDGNRLRQARYFPMLGHWRGHLQNLLPTQGKMHEVQHHAARCGLGQIHVNPVEHRSFPFHSGEPDRSALLFISSQER
jgi:hypothetical protein